jgi:hypothetical protein
MHSPIQEVVVKRGDQLILSSFCLDVLKRAGQAVGLYAFSYPGGRRYRRRSHGYRHCSGSYYFL